MNERVTDIDDRAVLTFFRSRRSGLARLMEGVVARIAHTQRARVRVTTVDVDEQPEIAARFAVTEVPTLVLIDLGRVLARLEGQVRGPQIVRLLDEHLGPDTLARPPLAEPA